MSTDWCAVVQQLIAMTMERSVRRDCGLRRQRGDCFRWSLGTHLPSRSTATWSRDGVIQSSSSPMLFSALCVFCLATDQYTRHGRECYVCWNNCVKCGPTSIIILCNALHCYENSVCQYVCLSVCLSVTLVSPVKTTNKMCMERYFISCGFCLYNIVIILRHVHERDIPRKRLSHNFVLYFRPIHTAVLHP